MRAAGYAGRPSLDGGEGDDRVYQAEDQLRAGVDGDTVRAAPVHRPVLGSRVYVPRLRPEGFLRLLAHGRAPELVCLFLCRHAAERTAPFLVREDREFHVRAGDPR